MSVSRCCSGSSAWVLPPPPQSKGVFVGLRRCQRPVRPPVRTLCGWMDERLPQLVSHLIPSPHQTPRRVLLVFHETA